MSSIIIGLTVMVLFSCENDMNTIQSLTQADTLPSESAKNIEVRYSDSGLLKAVLKSPKLLKYSGDDPYMLFPEGIHVMFYDSLEQMVSEIKSDYAISREKDDLMEARRNVIVMDYENQKELNTEVLFWDQKKREIYNNVFVTIKEKGRIMHGDSMRADENLDRFELFQVRATIDILEGDTTKNE